MSLKRKKELCMKSIADYELAEAEARTLALYIWGKFYKLDSPNFELLDTLSGVISQIDNMVTGLKKID
jgi:hypothetical protein